MGPGVGQGRGVFQIEPASGWREPAMHAPWNDKLQMAQGADAPRSPWAGRENRGWETKNGPRHFVAEALWFRR